MVASMNASETRSGRQLFGMSPWLIVGISLLLSLVILSLSLHTSEREQRNMTQNLTERASALFWALEAGTRTWMGFHGESRLLQQLVEETAKQPGIRYLVVADPNGKILADSDPKRVGARLDAAEPASVTATGNLAWHTRRYGDTSVFEVYRLFKPVRKDDGDAFCLDRENCSMHGHMRGAAHGGMGMWRTRAAADPAPDYENSVVYVGLDKAPYEEALAADRHSNLMAAGIVAALGLGGCLSMFWAHHYRRSRRLLMDTQALASEVITNLPLGLLTSVPDGRVGMANAAALRLIGIEGNRVAGKDLRSLPGPDWRALDAALERGERVLDREMEFARAGGGRSQVSLSASRITARDGQFLGHLFMLHDVGEVKRLRLEVERNERLTALGRLAAGAAHEIRNPLSSIKGMATFLAGKMPPGGREEEAAKTIVGEANRLNRVVSELLEFARPSGAKLATADVQEVIRHALRLAASDLASKKITVDFTDGRPVSGVRLNSERFVQALLNLFLNAIQAMQPGGRLHIALVEHPESESLDISIADDGAGMSEEVRRAAFTPYYTTKPGGTGLGLAIVQQIIDEHGGSIAVRSAPGMGSEFTLSLPLKAA